jgi:uncharacterized membrane protein
MNRKIAFELLLGVFLGTLGAIVSSIFLTSSVIVNTVNHMITIILPGVYFVTALVSDIKKDHQPLKRKWFFYGYVVGYGLFFIVFLILFTMNY